MPEHIRALVVILFLAFAVFAFAGKPSRAIVGRQDFNRRRNLWLLVTAAAFMAPNFWIYALMGGLLLLASQSRETNPVALYFMLLFAIPAGNTQLPGLGLVNYLFSLSHQRLLALAILLPAFLILVKKPESTRFGRLLPDKLIAGYMLLVVTLYLRETSVTDTLRQAFYQFIDVFLPYFVISRGLHNIQDFRAALLAFIVAVMIMALTGVLEAAKHWLLYGGLTNTLGLNQAMTGYLGRSGFLRAIASAGHPIALGYVMAIATVLYFFLQSHIQQKLIRRLGFLLLVAGQLAALSRGPWVGFAFATVVFILTGRHAVKRLSVMALAAVVALPLLAAMPGGEKIINLIPFIGETEKENITYRERLLENATIVIERNLWLGSTDYLQTPEMESMRQGQGIIDLVNTFIQVALETGVIGLSLFVGFFLSVLIGIYRRMNIARSSEGEVHLLGRSLLAASSGMLVIIFTVSSITIIPIVYFSMAAMGVAYANLTLGRKQGGEISNTDSFAPRTY